MPATYEPIATQNITNTSTTSVTFSSLATTYTDLRASITLISPTSTQGLFVRFNGDTGTNYSNTRLRGIGSAVDSFRDTNWNTIPLGTISNQYIFSDFNVFSYAGSINKTCLYDFNADANGSGSVWRSVALWRNTSAISSLTIGVDSGGYFQGQITLYGIKAA